jgi:hypothetical protein
VSEKRRERWTILYGLQIQWKRRLCQLPPKLHWPLGDRFSLPQVMDVNKSTTLLAKWGPCYCH